MIRIVPAASTASRQDRRIGADVFAGAPRHSRAAAYGAIGVGFRARKRAARAARSS